jgi:hypothetical protein
MAHDVFISYSSKDKPTADAACALLESSGVRCWIAPRDVLPGRDWGEALVDAIAESRVMVLIFSAHANQSPQVRREVERAVNKGVVIVPFRIENVSPCKALEYFISVPHWMDAYGGPLEKHLARLAETVRALIQSGGKEHSSLPSRPRRAVVKKTGAAKGQAAYVALIAAAAAGAGGLLYWNMWPRPDQASGRTQDVEPTRGTSSFQELAPPPQSRVVALPPMTKPATTAPALVDARAEAHRRAVEADARKLHLTSIALVGKQRFCMIDGNFVHEGETYDEFLVQKILTDRVIIAREGWRFEVRPPPPRVQENDSPNYVPPAPRNDRPSGGPRFDGGFGGGQSGPGPSGPPPGGPGGGPGASGPPPQQGPGGRPGH